MRRNPVLCAVSPVSQNTCGQYLNDFYIFLAGKYASFGHLRLLSQSLRKVVAFERKVRQVAPKDFVDFHFAATQILTEWGFFVHISQHNGNYRMISFYWYVLCIGILLSWHANDVMFLGCQPILGRKRITLPEPYSSGVPFGTCICSTCWDQSFSRACSNFFRTIQFEHPSVLSRFASSKFRWISLNSCRVLQKIRGQSGHLRFSICPENHKIVRGLWDLARSGFLFGFVKFCSAFARRVARVLSMWKHFQGRGFGGRLEAPNGSRAKPWWGPRGRSPRKLLDFTHLQSRFLR